MNDLSDFPGVFWGIWVVFLVVSGLAVLAWLLFAVYRARGESAAAPADQIWDETLTEGDAPPPVWWFYMLVGFLFFTVVYLVLYPGLGPFRGILEWTQFKQFEDGREYYAQKYAAVESRRLNAPFGELRADKALMKSAARIFDNHCAACHGANARGQAGLFPDLMDSQWQWGGGEEQIIQTLRNGRRAVMPAWGAVIGEEGARQGAAYVLALAAGEGELPAHGAGKTLYMQFCIACHGASGEGNPVLGAPSLAGDAWLYGGDEESVYQSIFAGRSGHMPAQTRLSDAQIRLLAAWLTGGAKTAGFAGAR